MLIENTGILRKVGRPDAGTTGYVVVLFNNLDAVSVRIVPQLASCRASCTSSGRSARETALVWAALHQNAAAQRRVGRSVQRIRAQVESAGV